MQKLKDWACDHIEGIMYAITGAAIIGFGLICFSLGKYDC